MSVMRPPISEIAEADSGVRAVLKTGAGPVRFWPFGRAPQKGEPGYGIPYAVFQTVRGTPDNTLSGRPKMDTWGEQIDVYGRTPEQTRQVAFALQYALELDAYVVSYNGEYHDDDTQLERYSFTVEFMTSR